MNKGQWSRQVGGSDAALRAGGRRRYNAAKTRRMWERRFAILRMLAAAGDFPHGAQRRLAEHFKVDKASISRDVNWARKNLMPDDGFTLRCSYRRRTVTITWTNKGIADLFRDARNVAKMARKWLK